MCAKRNIGIILTLLMMCLFTLPFEVQSGGAKPTSSPSLLPAYSETGLPVPFYYQEKDYYCGPAALQMVFDYYGENISQSEIACVARSIGDPLYVTYNDELRRAGHFSNFSTSMGDELPGNITGYTMRQLGYSAFEAQGMDLTTLKNLLDQGKPLILLMWYSGYHVSTHYRVATGYNETHVFLHDPWNKPSWGGTYGGPNLAFNNSQFLDLWSYYNNWALYISPWTINFSAPTHITPGTPFQIESTITYPQSPPNALSTYPASSCNASIDLPASLHLAQGENQKKTVGTGFLQAGDSSSLTWMLISDSSVTGTVTITVEGMVSGSVWGNENYTAYSYSDRIGATVNFTVNLSSAPHDIAVTNVLPCKTIVGQGLSLNISVTVANLGSYTENFNVTAYFTPPPPHTFIIVFNIATVSLDAGKNITISLVWDTTGMAFGNYTFTATAVPVQGEANTGDNTFTYGRILITIPGDINSDLKVSLSDLVLLANAYGSKPGDAKWNPNADIDGNGDAGLSDLVTLAQHYGQHYP